MLYYVNHVDILQKFGNFLTLNGTIAVTIWSSKKEKILRQKIFLDASLHYNVIDMFDLSGKFKKTGKHVTFLIAAFGKKERNRLK